MNIGFDAKRAFHNGTGLGHYSRTLIHSLALYYPANEYFLFNPKASHTFTIQGQNIQEIQPSGIINNLFPSWWRSSGVKRDLLRNKINLYHGLSHELPVNINKTGVSSVVTMHDLIHERFPGQYNKMDVSIYKKKFRYAAQYADHIIAISKQTRSDLMEIYNVPGEKIDVCYQSCDPSFSKIVPDVERKIIQRVLGLPTQFFLYVGSIIERKNLLTICKALRLLKDIPIPLVVIGDGGKYKQHVKDYLIKNDLQNRVIFLSENSVAQKEPAFKTAKMFPAIYQSAIAMIYPSIFEGFGIPVLESLCSGTPVITSNVSSLPEAGGDGAFYIDPFDEAQLAAGMRKIYLDPVFAESLRNRGKKYAENFTTEKTAAKVMEVYKRVV